MNLATELRNIIESIYSPAVSYLYVRQSEADLDLCDTPMPAVVVYPFGTFNLDLNTGNRIMSTYIVTIEFLQNVDFINDSEDNASEINDMETLAKKFLDYMNSENTIFKRLTDRVQGSIVFEQKYNINAVGVSITLELTPRSGYINIC